MGIRFFRGALRSDRGATMAIIVIAAGKIGKITRVSFLEIKHWGSQAGLHCQSNHVFSANPFKAYMSHHHRLHE